MKCDACGNESARKIRLQVVDHPEDMHLVENKRRTAHIWSCDKCTGMGIGLSVFRDAMGNKVTVTHEQAYSYAIDGPITSARQLSEVLKKNNLVQTGGGDGKSITHAKPRD